MATPQRTPPAPTIDLLLNVIDTRPQSILTSLSQHPQLASASDAHGYSLVHAAVSYNQLDVLRELMQTYNVNVNILDEDGETALFHAETADVARCWVEELGGDSGIRNTEGKTAQEKFLEEEGEAHEVYQYLRSSSADTANGANSEMDGVHPPPPLPEGIKDFNVGTMDEGEAGDEPDPEFRRRIEELAARDDFQTEEGQRQLRELVSEVVTGMGTDQSDRVRRRVD
jgi:hypothetical protein